MPKFKLPKLKLMPKLNAKTHIAMGLAFLVITLLLAAVSLHLIPDRIGAIREGRAALAETVAINSSAWIIKDDYKVLKLILGMVVERNPDIISAAVRHNTGKAIVTINEHEWVEDGGDYSTDTHLKVPIWSGKKKWGQVELRFTALTAKGWLAFVDHPLTKLTLFMGLLSFILFWFYLRRMLKSSVGGETKQGAHFYHAQKLVFAKHGLANNPWDSAVQFRDELITKRFPADSGFEAT